MESLIRLCLYSPTLSIDPLSAWVVGVRSRCLVDLRSCNFCVLLCVRALQVLFTALRQTNPVDAVITLVLAALEGFTRAISAPGNGFTTQDTENAIQHLFNLLQSFIVTVDSSDHIVPMNNTRAIEFIMDTKSITDVDLATKIVNDFPTLDTLGGSSKFLAGATGTDHLVPVSDDQQAHLQPEEKFFMTNPAALYQNFKPVFDENGSTIVNRDFFKLCKDIGTNLSTNAAELVHEVRTVLSIATFQMKWKIFEKQIVKCTRNQLTLVPEPKCFEILNSNYFCL